MPIEYEMRDGALVWIKNPMTGVISYVVDVRGKSFAFTLGGRDELDPAAPTLGPDEIAKAQAVCPFCPGNETMAPAEIFRVTPAEFPQWKGDGTAEGTGAGAAWVMRVFNNLFPRIPAELTGGRNESYIVVEDPRHFLEPLSARRRRPDVHRRARRGAFPAPDPDRRRRDAPRDGESARCVRS